MRFIFFFLFYIIAISVIGQPFKVKIAFNNPEKYPKEYKRINAFKKDALIDTFDSYQRILFIQKDSICKSLNSTPPYFIWDSGIYFFQPSGSLIINTTKARDTFDILKLGKQIILVNKNYRIYFVKDYEATKAWYKKSRKNRRHTFKYILESDLYLNPYCYHKRAEYHKWLIDQSKHKAISN